MTFPHILSVVLPSSLLYIYLCPLFLIFASLFPIGLSDPLYPIFSLFIAPPPKVSFTLLVSAVTPGNIITSENLELGTQMIKKNKQCLSFGSGLAQYDLCQFHSFTCEIHDFIFFTAE